MSIALPDVYGPGEAVQLLGISRARLHQLTDLPEARELSIGRVWDGPTLRAYAADRRDGREKGTRVRSTALRSYRQTGSVAAAARAAGVDPATVRRWMRALSVPLPRDSD